jgi:hypothetical protein
VIQSALGCVIQPLDETFFINMLSYDVGYLEYVHYVAICAKADAWPECCHSRKSNKTTVSEDMPLSRL